MNSYPHGTLLGFLWANRRRFHRGVMMALLRCLIIAPCPWLFQVIIDEHIKSGSVSGIFSIAAIFVGLLLIHYAFSVSGAVMIGREMTELMMNLRGEIFNKLHFLNFGYLDRQKSGRLLSKYAFDTQKIESTLTDLLNQFAPNILYSVSISIILVCLHWQLSIVLLLMIPIWGYARVVFHKAIVRSHEITRLAQEKLTGTASEVITALRLVRSLGEEQQVTDQVDRRSSDLARSKLDQVSVSSMFGTFMYISTQALSLLTVAGGAYFVIQGTMTLGTLLAFMAGLPIIMMPVNLFANLSQQYFAGQEGFRSIKELLDCEYVEDWHGTLQITALRGDVHFDHVSFAYPGTDRRVLHDYSLHVRPGEHIALVGPSGAGKSTVTHLLLGLYKPDTGQILVDGAPLSAYDMRWLRKQTAVVMQDNLLLSGSVADNIRFARPDASMAEVEQAARQANADEFILKMPDGYNTAIGERGVMLSGGQRQRISIARAILRNPKILILDEATSALDYESEKLVQEALERLATGRTVITIAHRLSTVRRAHRVIVMQQGRILEEGTFDELQKRGGFFSDMLLANAIGPSGQLVT